MKTAFLYLLFAVLIFLLPSTTLAQKQHDGKEQTHKEIDPGWEAVFSVVGIYNTHEKNTDPATELHITYWINHFWAFGIGYSLVFEKHNDDLSHEIAQLTSFKPEKWLTINVGPSFALPNAHNDLEISAYLETEFAFKIGDFHTGPTLGNLIGEDYKVFAGAHISYEF